ncbi:MAG TPA: hypothetical protein VHK91_09850 [Flavisolibacter sp.]|jgi:hypothetical protein|nr:hypothetical protein [Flavisolibacter sp.]
MKKIFFATLTLLFSFAVRASEEPTEKVLEAFNKTFLNVKDVTWDTYNNQYEAKFSQSDIKVRVWYDADGNVVKALRYYYGETLPIFIRSKLNRKYEGKHVFGVTEESSDETITYHIILEDEKNWIDVKADAFGNMYTEKKYKKG